MRSLTLFLPLLAGLAGCADSGVGGRRTGPPRRAGAAAALPAAPAPRLDVDARAEYLRRRLEEGFTVVVEPPFVVIGDAPADEVQRHADRTVRWAAARLRRDFFARDPSRVIEVWLFAGEDSYLRNARAVFGDEPTTPYGYYAPSHGALIMNIDTGGGTLVHEMVHAYMETNAPGCPAWLNEGLGSLFEQSMDVDGHIRGLTNWRLPGLQRALRAGVPLPTFAELAAMGDDDFYAEKRGTNYAQARYLLYYLQERGLLVTFWRAYLAGRAEDPTGYAALLETLGAPDMARFQAEWRQFVLGLRFDD